MYASNRDNHLQSGGVYVANDLSAHNTKHDGAFDAHVTQILQSFGKKQTASDHDKLIHAITNSGTPVHNTKTDALTGAHVDKLIHAITNSGTPVHNTKPDAKQTASDHGAHVTHILQALGKAPEHAKTAFDAIHNQSMLPYSMRGFEPSSVVNMMSTPAFKQTGGHVPHSTPSISVPGSDAALHAVCANVFPHLETVHDHKLANKLATVIGSHQDSTPYGAAHDNKLANKLTHVINEHIESSHITRLGSLVNDAFHKLNASHYPPINTCVCGPNHSEDASIAHKTQYGNFAPMSTKSSYHDGLHSRSSAGNGNDNSHDNSKVTYPFKYHLEHEKPHSRCSAGNGNDNSHDNSKDTNPFKYHLEHEKPHSQSSAGNDSSLHYNSNNSHGNSTDTHVCRYHLENGKPFCRLEKPFN